MKQNIMDKQIKSLSFKRLVAIEHDEDRTIWATAAQKQQIRKEARRCGYDWAGLELAQALNRRRSC
jgi:hypothetical protein